MYTVYKHTTQSGKVYVGITKQKPARRWQNGNGYKNNEHFYRAILKYGWENIKHEIVCADLNKWQACKVEQSLIQYFDSTNPDKGYNNSVGGEFGALGHKVSAEARQKMSKALKGVNNPWYGKHLSAETRQKMSESQKGKHRSAETRQKLSEAHKGKTSPRKGKHLSAETRRKLSEAHQGKIPQNRRPVICIETGTLYSSVTEAAKSVGVTQPTISAVLRGVLKTAGGYHWKYVENMEESK